MNDLSLHILDLALNSIHANARNVLISIEQNTQEQLFFFFLEDNGDGMEQSVLQRALEPGFTTKEKGLGGMGLPRLSETVQNMQGTLLLESEAGWGTRVKATFHTGGRDASFVGDMAQTMAALLSGFPEVDVMYRHRKDRRGLLYSTAQARWRFAGEARPGFAAYTWTRTALEQELSRL